MPDDRTAGSRERLSRISHYFLSDLEGGQREPNLHTPPAQVPVNLLVEPAHLDGPAAITDVVKRAFSSHRGVGCVVEPELPCEGSPLLALDAAARPLLVSVDARTGCAALLNGLTAWEELLSGRKWIARLYPNLPERLLEEHLRLLVVAPEKPSGWAVLARSNPRLGYSGFRILSMEGRVGVLFEDDDGWVVNGANHRPGALSPAPDGIAPERVAEVDEAMMELKLSASSED